MKLWAFALTFSFVLGLSPFAGASESNSCDVALNSTKRSPVHSFRIGTLNLFNFNSPKKPEEHRRLLAKAILDNDLDLVAIQEIKNEGRLREFNEQYLGGRYIALSAEGNKKNQNIGFLIRKNPRLRAKLKSHADETWTHPTSNKVEPLFARDFAELELTDRESGRTLAKIGGIHLKSKIVREDLDDPSIQRRKEIERILDLWSDSSQNVPEFILGDSNGTLEEDPEISLLHENGFVDVLSAHPAGPQDLKHTHIYFPSGQGPRFQKLDLIAVRNLGREGGPRIVLKKAFVHSYRDENGMLLDPKPTSFRGLQALPSDHFLVVAEFDLDPSNPTQHSN